MDLQKAQAKKVITLQADLTEDLERLAKDLGIREHVKFVGSVDYSEMPLYYQSADVYVQMPSSDGLPYSLLEAMACGLPVISTPVGGNAENIEEARNGFLVEVGNCRDLAERILYLMTEQNKIEEFGKQSLDLIHRNHDKKSRIQRYKQMYESVLKHAKA